MPIFRERLALGPRHPMHPGWREYTPHIRVGTRQLRLRPLRRSDGPQWCELRIDDERFLRPVEPTPTAAWHLAHSSAAWRATYRYLSRSAAKGETLPLAIEVNGEFSGQLTIGNIQHATAQEGWVGYWLHSSLTGHHIATAAVALAIDHAFNRVGLHRLTATHLPSNKASRRILERNGFREEGLLKENLHIDGRWRDHYLMALTRSELQQTAVQRISDQGIISKKPSRNRRAL
ncbi:MULTISPECIES: GNAT family N-acetyltransferase [unclassified Corynebacterium]|uniref:GNAT family N-acetyltransferase n=1 Tax=unclassified Corynebacterium TaxID=2624378 RepID=UPI00216844E1|nr:MULTISPECIES: GNAT family protein [unclassified Corynebacterium]MCS4491629.1 GNAT family N-acetyltransferase [Corynebacterium sp. ES2715-CONJ3]MCS4531734.1 GNAT family N-acetyltransferase [Corynebacterium sp. ES2730-CONJ]